MSYEKLHPSDLQGSLEIYLSASILIDTLEAEIPRTVPTAGSPNPQASSYTQYLELWRWVEQLLWRTIAIAVRISTDEPTLSALFRQYFACSSHWIPSFRPQHRSTVSTLFLHFVISQAKTTKNPSSDMGTPSWLPEARSVIQEYRSVLNVSTKFPRAGERNVLVEEFVDLCVATWEAGGAVGEHVGWVLDVRFFSLYLLDNLRSPSFIDSMVGNPANVQLTSHLSSHVKTVLCFGGFKPGDTNSSAICTSGGKGVGDCQRRCRTETRGHEHK